MRKKQSIITKIQREVWLIISDRRDISMDNKLSTRFISLADTLKDKRSLIEGLDHNTLDMCDIEEIKKEVKEKQK